MHFFRHIKISFDFVFINMSKKSIIKPRQRLKVSQSSSRYTKWCKIAPDVIIKDNCLERAMTINIPVSTTGSVIRRWKVHGTCHGAHDILSDQSEGRQERSQR